MSTSDLVTPPTARWLRGGGAWAPGLIAAALFVAVTALHRALGGAHDGAALALYALPTVLLAERLRRTERGRRRLAAAVDRHRLAVETNDNIVQHLSAARWSLQAGNAERALVIMDEAVELGHRMVSDLVRDAELGIAWVGDRRTADETRS